MDNNTVRLIIDELHIIKKELSDIRGEISNLREGISDEINGVKKDVWSLKSRFAIIAVTMGLAGSKVSEVLSFLK